MTRSTPSRQRAGAEKPGIWIRSRSGRLCTLAGFIALAAAAGVGLMRGHAQAAPAPAAETPQKTASSPTPAANQQQNAPTVDATEAVRKQEITNECADLLKMATDLKTEVDKTTKDTLSVTVVRKAGEIEQLAHRVRTGSPKD